MGVFKNLHRSRGGYSGTASGPPPPPSSRGASVNGTSMGDLTGDVQSDNLQLTVEQALQLFNAGIMGTIEFRGWLAQRSPEFRRVRDPELDEHIQYLAEKQRRRYVEEVIDFAGR